MSTAMPEVIWKLINTGMRIRISGKKCRILIPELISLFLSLTPTLSHLMCLTLSFLVLRFLFASSVDVFFSLSTFLTISQLFLFYVLYSLCVSHRSQSLFLFISSSLTQVMVEAGSSVEAGDPLVVMIAMKMEYVIKVSYIMV